jgi:hypothetical protein
MNLKDSKRPMCRSFVKEEKHKLLVYKLQNFKHKVWSFEMHDSIGLYWTIAIGNEKYYSFILLSNLMVILLQNSTTPFNFYHWYQNDIYFEKWTNL